MILKLSNKINSSETNLKSPEMTGEQSQEQQGTKTATGVKTSSKLMEEEWEQWVCVAGVCVSE